MAAQPHCSTLITALVHPRTQSQTKTDKDGIRDGQTVTMATSPCDYHYLLPWQPHFCNFKVHFICEYLYIRIISAIMDSPKVGCGRRFWSLPNTSLPPSGPVPNFSPENAPGFCSKVTPPKPPWALLALPANGKGDFEVDSVFNALSEFFAAENVNVGFASISVGCC